MKKYTIDLSALTKEEVSQIRDNATILESGCANVALYLRFSSDRQSEQSIEGQLRDAIAYCKCNSYRVTAVYVDRATTARKDVENRTSFLQMIADSDKRRWQYILVWKLDRFMRNRADSAVYKMKLRRNGVRVLSVTEHIPDNPEGIILESVLEGMAEFYSAELSQKITRGMRESALKCQSIGGTIPLGYKVDNHKLVIDHTTAPIVQRAFELYANGWTVADICRDFNARGYKTARGAEFNANSFKSMFKNKRYIGTYLYKDMEVENGMPAIIDDALFAEVGKRLKKNQAAPAHSKARVDYLLSGKLFCGHCGEMMIGDCGTSKTGVTHYYYTCSKRKRRGGCHKKSLRKDVIEMLVAKDAMEMLTDETIDEIADMAVNQIERDIRQDTQLPALRSKQAEIDKSITNIVAAVEKGVASDTLLERLSLLEQEKKSVARRITEEETQVVKLTKEQIIYWLSQFRSFNIDDEKCRRELIDLLINSVTVYDLPDGDFEITTAYNLTSQKTKTFHLSESSDMSSYAPPKKASPEGDAFFV